MEKLRTREYKVENLREKEKNKCFRKMALNRYSGEGHAGEVTECVAGESSGRIPGIRDFSVCKAHQLCQRKPEHMPTSGAIK